MQNPFESGHVKNYILLYASVVVIMVLFFAATTLFHDVKSVEKKVFAADESVKVVDRRDKQEHNPKEKFKLLDKSY